MHVVGYDSTLRSNILMPRNQQHQKSASALQVDASIQAKQSKVIGLGAGQVKQVAVPVGKTLEETIALWKNVRNEAVSTPEPTTADYQLAAKATSKIRQTEAQIALHHYAQTEIDRASAVEEAESAKIASIDLPSKLDYDVLEKNRRYEQAISTYAYHVQMKQQGFEIDGPSFYRIA